MKRTIGQKAAGKKLGQPAGPRSGNVVGSKRRTGIESEQISRSRPRPVPQQEHDQLVLRHGRKCRSGTDSRVVRPLQERGAIDKRGTGIEVDSEVSCDARTGRDSNEHWGGRSSHCEESTGRLTNALSPTSTKHNPRAARSLMRCTRKGPGHCPKMANFWHRRCPWDNGSFGSFLFFCRPGARTPLWRRRSPRVCCVEDHNHDMCMQARRPQPRSPTLPPWVGWLGEKASPVGKHLL